MKFKIKHKVRELLIQFPHLRDNDFQLVSSVWLHEIPNVNQTTARGVLALYSNGKLTDPASIMRSRRRLQEKDPSLRGKLWNKRHNEFQEETLNELDLFEKDLFNGKG